MCALVSASCFSPVFCAEGPSLLIFCLRTASRLEHVGTGLGGGLVLPGPWDDSEAGPASLGTTEGIMGLWEGRTRLSISSRGALECRWPFLFLPVPGQVPMSTGACLQARRGWPPAPYLHALFELWGRNEV